MFCKLWVVAQAPKSVRAALRQPQALTPRRLCCWWHPWVAALPPSTSPLPVALRPLGQAPFAAFFPLQGKPPVSQLGASGGTRPWDTHLGQQGQGQAPSTELDLLLQVVQPLLQLGLGRAEHHQGVQQGPWGWETRREQSRAGQGWQHPSGVSWQSCHPAQPILGCGDTPALLPPPSSPPCHPFVTSAVPDCSSPFSDTPSPDHQAFFNFLTDPKVSPKAKPDLQRWISAFKPPQQFLGILSVTGTVPRCCSQQKPRLSPSSSLALQM